MDRSSLFQHAGKAFLPQSERASVEAQHLHPQQPLGRLSKRARVHGGCESTVKCFIYLHFYLAF